MNSLINKFELFFEFVIMGLAFGVAGYQFMLSYNTSFIGILGIMAILFGFYNVLIGVYIFGAYFFALLFKPDWLQSDHQPVSLMPAKERHVANSTLQHYSEEEEEEFDEVKQLSFLGQLWRESILIETFVLALLIILC